MITFLLVLIVTIAHKYKIANGIHPNVKTFGFLPLGVCNEKKYDFLIVLHADCQPGIVISPGK